MKRNLGLALGLSVLVAWPLVPGVPYDVVNTAVLAAMYIVVAASIVLLIGLVGQISLAQAALVGVGAFLAALSTRSLGLHFPFTLGVGMAAGALTATVIGMVALRVRGLYLAVASLIFAYICDRYLFLQPWLVESQSGTSIPFETIGRPGTIPFFDLGDIHVLYYVALSVACLALYAVANVRDSKYGRGFAAVRGSEVAAASLGIAVTRFKLMGFAMSGALAGMAGALALTAQRSISPAQFSFMDSLYFLAIAVVGGLRSLGGGIASAVIFALMVGELFFRQPRLSNWRDLISSGLLIVVLLFFRGGLGALPDRVRPWAAALGRRLGPVAKPLQRVGSMRFVRRPSWRRRTAVPAVLGKADVAQLEPEEAATIPEVVELHPKRDSADQQAGTVGPGGRREPVLLAADGITVRFGGLTAVENASLRVGAGEIVGLIGPNGAGKTTLFNSILGLNTPAAGRVQLFGKDVTGWPVHRRARLGVGRTFQVLQLLPDMSVFENLMVATHLQDRSTVLGALVVSRGAQRAVAASRARVVEVMRQMGLDGVADRPVRDLPFGVLRLVEVARTVVTGARLACFDEPASGLDSSETEDLIDRLRGLRDRGTTILVIEHDVDMVVRLCDYIYVLDQGHLLADGTPEQIQADPQVIASYLGTGSEAA